MHIVSDVLWVKCFEFKVHMYVVHFDWCEKKTKCCLFFLQGKAPKEIHAILTETVACFFPGRTKDLSAPLCVWKHSYLKRYEIWIYSFLGVWRIRQKGPTSFVLAVRVYQRGFHWTDLRQI